MSSGVPQEEPWEHRIHELLSSLPPVDPPEGFLERAIDHRPKYAGRLTLSAVASVTVVALVLAGLGLVGDPASVAPPVPNLSERHLEATAGLRSPGRDQSALFERLPEDAEELDLPVGFQPRGARQDGDLVQLVYEHEGRPISIFLQRGSVAWGELPPEGRARVDGRPVWVDARHRVVVLEVGGYAVCVVGLDVDQALAVLRGRPEDRVTAADRLKSLAREVARQAGFP